jgi:hypothetical protein
MASAMINARNPLDSGLRIWGLGIDKIPSGNWLKDESIIKSDRHQGDQWDFDVALSNGKHTLYFIVSVTDPTKGAYSGEALFGKAGFTFAGVDNDSVAQMDVVVKGDSVTRADGKDSKTTDIDTTDSSSKFNGFKKFGTKIASIKDLSRDTWIKIAAIGGAIGGGVIVAYLVLGRKKRRRF